MLRSHAREKCEQDEGCQLDLVAGHYCPAMEFVFTFEKGNLPRILMVKNLPFELAVMNCEKNSFVTPE